jgi:hypothetical protein
MKNSRQNIRTPGARVMRANRLMSVKSKFSRRLSFQDKDRPLCRKLRICKKTGFRTGPSLQYEDRLLCREFRTCKKTGSIQDLQFRMKTELCTGKLEHVRRQAPYRTK